MHAYPLHDFVVSLIAILLYIGVLNMIERRSRR